MNSNLIPLNTYELAFIGFYLLSLVAVGWLGFRARREDSLRDFYLGGRSFGVLVLLLTLYSTQYSGNTLFGFTWRTYRIGFAWTVSIHFMTSIVVGYFCLARRLHRLARLHDFVTPTDFLTHRFGSRPLSLIASLVMVAAIANFLVAQLMAMGNAVEGFVGVPVSGAEQTSWLAWDSPYTLGVVGLACIVVVYETLGGFRAVAWTDVIQGGTLLVGFLMLLGLAFHTLGDLPSATEVLYEREGLTPGGIPAAESKVAPPTPGRSREWFSYVLLVGIGGALYPQAIQRLYAARNAHTLRISLSLMAVLPLTTALVTLIVGILGLAYVPGLISEEFVQGELVKVDRADTLLTVICRRIQEDSLLGRSVVVVLLAAILAAIMSTADSVVLSISSMLTKDIYGVYVRPFASEKELTRVGKLCSWGLVAVGAWLAIWLRETTLVQLLDRKFDLLVQLGPAFFLGLYWPRLAATPTLIGLLVGLAVALGCAAASISRWWGVHPGLWGLVFNLLVACLGSLWVTRRSA